MANRSFADKNRIPRRCHRRLPARRADVAVHPPRVVGKLWNPANLLSRNHRAGVFRVGKFAAAACCVAARSQSSRSVPNRGARFGGTVQSRRVAGLLPRRLRRHRIVENHQAGDGGDIGGGYLSDPIAGSNRVARQSTDRAEAHFGCSGGRGADKRGAGISPQAGKTNHQRIPAVRAKALRLANPAVGGGPGGVSNRYSGIRTRRSAANHSDGGTP